MKPKNPMFRNGQVIQSHAAEFVRIFKVPLRPFMNPLIGFDVVKFDADLLGGTDRSALECIQEKYGDEGVALVQAIMATEMEFLNTVKQAITP